MYIYIIHGYKASTGSHWFPWLKNILESKGNKVKIITLPNPETPKAKTWQGAIESEIKEVNLDALIITHSLGGIAALRFLESPTKDWELGGLISVSGFYEKLPNLPELNQFISCCPDIEKLASNISKSIVVNSNDD